MKIKSLYSGMRVYFLMLALLVVGMDAYAQEKSIKLVDKQDGTAIRDVHFTYN